MVGLPVPIPKRVQNLFQARLDILMLQNGAIGKEADTSTFEMLRIITKS
jgi:hypothetical protein